jgi:hypothetical protein
MVALLVSLCYSAGAVAGNGELCGFGKSAQEQLALSYYRYELISHCRFYGVPHPNLEALKHLSRIRAEAVLHARPGEEWIAYYRYMDNSHGMCWAVPSSCLSGPPTGPYGPYYPVQEKSPPSADR